MRLSLSAALVFTFLLTRNATTVTPLGAPGGRPAWHRGLPLRRAARSARQTRRPHHQPQRIDRSKTPDIDLIARHKDLKLVALLAPEHGIRGDAAAGEKIADETDREDRRADLLALQGRGSRADAGDAEGRRRAGLRPAGSRRPHVDLRLDDGAVDAGGREEGDPVRRPRPAQPDRRRDRRRRAARSGVQVVRRDVSDPGAPWDDRRRAGDAVQPEATASARI